MLVRAEISYIMVRFSTNQQLQNACLQYPDMSFATLRCITSFECSYCLASQICRENCRPCLSSHLIDSSTVTAGQARWRTKRAGRRNHLPL